MPISQNGFLRELEIHTLVSHKCKQLTTSNKCIVKLKMRTIMYETQLENYFWAKLSLFSNLLTFGTLGGKKLYVSLYKNDCSTL